MRDGIGDDAAELVVRCERRADEAAALVAFDEFVESPRIDFDRLHTAERHDVSNLA